MSESLFSFHPAPWKVVPSLPGSEKAFVRDANNGLVAMNFRSTESAQALVALVNKAAE